jgi:hypothetical protein
MDDLLTLTTRLIERWREMPNGEDREILKNDLLEIKEIAERNCAINGVNV